MKKNIGTLIIVIASLIVAISGITYTLYMLITNFPISPIIILFLLFSVTFLGFIPFVWVIEQIRRKK
jgi:hypothetical protein